MTLHQPFINPLRPLLHRFPFIVLDGGTSTALEASGLDLSHRLWSAHLLASHNADVQQILQQSHTNWLAAGAQLITTLTYQATIQGFCENLNVDVETATKYIYHAIDMACEARDAFVRQSMIPTQTVVRPLVGISIGPYAAYLADGSEYTGTYPASMQSVEALLDWHKQRLIVYTKYRQRVDNLRVQGYDLLVFETIPNITEVEALLKLFSNYPDYPCMLSVSCRNEHQMVDGTTIQRLCDVWKKYQPTNCLTLGINCTPPQHITKLLGSLRDQFATQQHPLLHCYCNSGEVYDGQKKTWTKQDSDIDHGFQRYLEEWHEQGAAVIGGCCRTTTTHIKTISQYQKCASHQDKRNNEHTNQTDGLPRLRVALKLHVADPYYQLLRSGRKTVEGRVAKQPVINLCQDDILELYTDELNSTLFVVTGLNFYPSFATMLQQEHLEHVLPGTSDVETGVQIYRQWSTQPAEDHFGVVAIRVAVAS